MWSQRVCFFHVCQIVYVGPREFAVGSVHVISVLEYVLCFIYDTRGWLLVNTFVVVVTAVVFTFEPYSDIEQRMC